MGTNTLSGKRLAVWMFAFVGACALALSVVLSAASPAYAGTRGPYLGYKNAGSTDVVGSGYLQMSSADPRNVKKGYENFYIYSNNSRYYNSATEKYVPMKKALRKLKGMAYNKKTNTLILKNVNAASFTLFVNGMGSGFKIYVLGKNALAGIEASYATRFNGKGNVLGYYPSSVTIDGPGALYVNKNKFRNSAISIDGSITYSTLTITKRPKVRLYAYGLSDVVTVSRTTAKGISKAIVIKGRLKSALIKRSVSIPGWTNYKSASVVDLRKSTASNQDIYKIGDKLYYVEYVYGDNMSSLCQVKKVGSTGFYAIISGSTTDCPTDDLPTPNATGKVITSKHYQYATTLNKGAYYSTQSDGAIMYFDTKARRYYSTKWDIYKKVAKVKGEVYVSIAKKGVAAKKDLPKGYSGVKEKSFGTSYSYSLKNSLVAAR